MSNNNSNSSKNIFTKIIILAITPVKVTIVVNQYDQCSYWLSCSKTGLCSAGAFVYKIKMKWGR